MKATVQIQKRFQVTIPEAVRTVLGLKEGDYLEVDMAKVPIAPWQPESKEPT